VDDIIYEEKIPEVVSQFCENFPIETQKLSLKYLCSKKLLKQRSRNKMIAYEITSEGKIKAEELLNYNLGTSKKFTNFLISHGEEKEGVFILMDDREGGGDEQFLFKHTKFFKKNGIKFIAKKIHLGDYQFEYKTKTQTLKLPFIIERKRIDDFAHSIEDGRFIAQKKRMKSYTKKHPEVTLVYLVEGDVYNNLDALRHVSMTPETILQAINYTRKEGFQIVNTKYLHDTLNWIASFAKTIETELMSCKNPLECQYILSSSLFSLSEPTASMIDKEETNNHSNQTSLKRPIEPKDVI